MLKVIFQEAQTIIFTVGFDCLQQLLLLSKKMINPARPQLGGFLLLEDNLRTSPRTAKAKAREIDAHERIV